MQYVYGYAQVYLQTVANIGRGVRVVREQLSTSEGYPVYQNSLTPLGFHSKHNQPANSTFVIGAGAAGEIGYSVCDYWAADDCFCFDCSELINQRYLYYCIKQSENEIKYKVCKASVPRLPRLVLENLLIELPPIEKQLEIVDLLDNFTNLLGDIQNGLPAEIEARQKQYEYYRDKLLTFKEKAQ